MPITITTPFFVPPPNLEPLDTEITSDNPTVYFRMDDSGVPLTDEQGCSTNTFEAGSSVNYQQPGKFGFSASSTGGYIRGEVCTGGLQSPQARNTFEFIMKRNGAPSSSDEYICGNYRSIAIGVEQTTGNLQIYYIQATGGGPSAVIVSPFAVCDNNWHHVIVTVDGVGTTWNAYVDGSQHTFPVQTFAHDNGYIGYGVYLFVRPDFFGNPVTGELFTGSTSLYVFYRNIEFTPTQVNDHYTAYQAI